jgi:hypothetical protein
MRPILLYLKEAIVGSRCLFCEKRIFWWQAKFWLYEPRGLAHNECATYWLSAEVQRAVRSA